MSRLKAIGRSANLTAIASIIGETRQSYSAYVAGQVNPTVAKLADWLHRWRAAGLPDIPLHVDASGWNLPAVPVDLWLVDDAAIYAQLVAASTRELYEAAVRAAAAAARAMGPCDVRATVGPQGLPEFRAASVPLDAAQRHTVEIDLDRWNAAPLQRAPRVMVSRQV